MPRAARQPFGQPDSFSGSRRGMNAVKCPGRDSNPRTPDYESVALTTELPGQRHCAALDWIKRSQRVSEALNG